MLRKYFGLPSSPKRKTQAEKDKEYETKRKRTIVPSWKKDFAWLITDDCHGKVYCKTCRSAYGQFSQNKLRDKFHKYSVGPFVVGSTNLRRDALVTHEKSEGHKFALDIEISRTAECSTAEKTLQTLNSAAFQRLEKLFRNAHAIAKQSKPLSDFLWICALEKKNDVDIGSTYLNTWSCKQFLIAIAEVERDKIGMLLSQAQFCTIMSDGSTDVSGVENEIVYVHFAIDGVTHCFFLGLIECGCANALGIYTAIMDALQFTNVSKEEILNKIIGFAGDGASVNTGKTNGVISQFQKRVNPSIVMIQCMAHRVELGMKDAMKNSGLFRKVTELLDDLFKFYRSAKQKAELKSCFESTNLPFAMPTRIGGTRWVGHMLLAIKNLIKGYRAYICHLSKVVETRSQSTAMSKAKNFLGKLRSKSVMFFIHFLIDVLTVLSTLSYQLQEREACVFQVHRQLETTLTNLQKLGERPGSELRKITSCSDTFEGEQLTGNLSEHNSQAAKVIETLMSCLKKRFVDLDCAVFRATKLADLRSWPHDIEESKDFGDDCLMVIMDHYRDILQRHVDVSAAEEEWTYLKQALYDSKQIHESSLTWAAVNKMYKDRCSNVLQVIDLILSIPSATAECERGFSQMKHTKTQYRNKLRSTSMTLLLTIQLHSATIAEFDPSVAIHRWNKMHHRRPDFLPRSQRSHRDAIVYEQHVAGDAVQVPEAGKAVDEGMDSDYGSDFSDLDCGDSD